MAHQRLHIFARCLTHPLEFPLTQEPSSFTFFSSFTSSFKHVQQREAPSFRPLSLPLRHGWGCKKKKRHLFARCVLATCETWPLSVWLLFWSSFFNVSHSPASFYSKFNLNFFSSSSFLHFRLGSRTQPGRSRLIYQLKIQTVLNVGNDWTLKSYEVGGRSKARLNFAIRVTCNENHFGEQCSHYCRSRDDSYGHYLCSETGQFICLPGWQGSDNYCKTRKYFCVTSSLILRKPVAYGTKTRTSFALATKHDSFSF